MHLVVCIACMLIETHGLQSSHVERERMLKISERCARVDCHLVVLLGTAPLSRGADVIEHQPLFLLYLPGFVPFRPFSFISPPTSALPL